MPSNNTTREGFIQGVLVRELNNLVDYAMSAASKGIKGLVSLSTPLIDKLFQSRDAVKAMTEAKEGITPVLAVFGILTAFLNKVRSFLNIIVPDAEDREESTRARADENTTTEGNNNDEAHPATEQSNTSNPAGLHGRVPQSTEASSSSAAEAQASVAPKQ